MNVEIGNEAAQFHFWEYTNRILFALQSPIVNCIIYLKNFPETGVIWRSDLGPRPRITEIIPDIICSSAYNILGDNENAPHHHRNSQLIRAHVIKRRRNRYSPPRCFLSCSAISNTYINMNMNIIKSSADRGIIALYAFKTNQEFIGYWRRDSGLRNILYVLFS